MRCLHADRFSLMRTAVTTGGQHDVRCLRADRFSLMRTAVTTEGQHDVRCLHAQALMDATWNV